MNQDSNQRVGRRATLRFQIAVTMSVIGLLLALFSGRAELAVLTVPWLVVLPLGLLTSARPSFTIEVEPQDERVLAGQTLDVVYRIGIGSPEVGSSVSGGSAGVLTMSWPQSLAPLVACPVVRGSPSEVSVSVSFAGWGTYNVGRVAVDFTERFGLVRWLGELHDPTPIRVHPDQLQLRKLLAPTRMHQLVGAHQSPVHDRGFEFAGVRPHQPGDSMGEINWRASARSDGLWVSQRHPDRSTDVVLLIDTFPDSYSWSDGESGSVADRDNGKPGSEATVRPVDLLLVVVRVAVALASRYLSAADRVGLVEMGGIVRWVSPGAGRQQLYRIIDAALAVQPFQSWARRDLSVVPRRAIPPNALVLGVSSLADDRFVDALIKLAGQGHDTAVVALDQLQSQLHQSDHSIESLTLPRPASSAERLWAGEQEMVRDRLARHGVTVAMWDRDLGVSSAGLQSVMNDLSRRRSGQSRFGRAKGVAVR